MLATAGLMLALYTFLYHSWDPQGAIGRCYHEYMRLIAETSAACLALLGEHLNVRDTLVNGRFPYVVVLDCTALDSHALFIAAVATFPSPLWTRLVGWIAGMVFIFFINVTRLVVLYYAGMSSRELFHTLHEEVFVFLIIALVCGAFASWASWASRARAPSTEAVPQT